MLQRASFLQRICCSDDIAVVHEEDVVSDLAGEAYLMYHRIKKTEDKKYAEALTQGGKMV